MGRLGVVQVGLAALGVVVSGCSGSFTLGARAAREALPARACVPASEVFQASTLEWDESSRRDLEARARRGAVVVRVEGCGWRVLDGCEAGARYVFRAEPLRRERRTAGSEMGMGVASGPALARSAGTVEEVSIAGVFDLDHLPSAADLQGACAGATHVVARYSAGAFRVEDGHARSGGVTLPYGARADARRWSTSTRQAGNPEACAQRPAGDGEPPVDCRALVDLSVVPIPAPPPPVVNAAVPLPVASGDACSAGDVAACDQQCRGGQAPACAALSARCASGWLPACLAASSSALERWMFAVK